MNHKCNHCNGLMAPEYDSMKCMNCGRRVWYNFALRKPNIDEKVSNMGCPTGTKLKGKDRIKAMI